MGWNRRDDGSNDHQKIRGLGSWEPDLLWQKAGVGCSKSKTGGVIAPADLELYGFLAYLRTPAKVRAAARKLVEAVLWHDHETVTDCDRCVRQLVDNDLALAPGWFMFHDWEDCNPTKKAEEDDVTKFKQQRARQLKDMVTRRAEVLARDRELCRYCGIRTTFKKGDQKSNTRRVIDHVDPMGNNDLGNLATACGRCNGRKKDRTPTEAGMPLLAPPIGSQPPMPYPEGYDPIDASDPGPRVPDASGPDQSRIEDAVGDAADRDRGSPSCVTRDGPGQVGIGPGVDSGSDRAPVGLGLAGLGSAGSGMAGLVRAEQGAAEQGTAPQGAATPQPSPDASDGPTSPATDATSSTTTGGTP